MTRFIPSIWLGAFSCYSDWVHAETALADAFRLLDSIDDRQLLSRHPFNVDAWCVQCTAVKKMQVTWHLNGTSSTGSIHPAWTETAVCSGCGLNSRMRALLAFLTEYLELSRASHVYISEQVTSMYRLLKKRYPLTVGSEYLGGDLVSGSKRILFNKKSIVQHENLTSLSFSSGVFDAVVTQDVFEHIPDYKAAFRECKRVLAPGGSLVFTVPFFYHSASTEIRSVIVNGQLDHILPPEYHGNPVGDGSSLCFNILAGICWMNCARSVSIMLMRICTGGRGRGISVLIFLYFVVNKSHGLYQLRLITI